MQAETTGTTFQASAGYRNYVIWLLFVVYVFNFIDRQILSILIQPIKEEFALTDTQLGLLGGLAFAIFYTALGIPIARWADKNNRVKVISVSLLIWSCFTAVTGLARNFHHLLITRILVGVGEAGCSPPAYSLISDYFPLQKRSTALSIYSMGIYTGIFLGFLVGGYVAQAFGWRAAFYVVGLPGVLLALIVRLTLREPPRGFSDAVRAEAGPPPISDVLRQLWEKHSFRHLSLAGALHSFVGYGVTGFFSAFLIRSHGMTLSEVGIWLAVIYSLGGVTGTFLGGFLSDRLSSQNNDSRYQLWVPAIATLLNVPFALLAYLLPEKFLVLALMIPAQACGAAFLGPTFAVTQGLVSVRERALAGSVLLLIVNLIGLGLGPLAVGMLSDVFQFRLMAQGHSLADATAQGLRWSLCVMMCVNFWAAFHYMKAAHTLRENLAAGSSTV